MARLPDGEEVDLNEVIDSINASNKTLTPWEENFLDSILNREYLSEKQVDVLQKICDKCGVDL